MRKGALRKTANYQVFLDVCWIRERFCGSEMASLIDILEGKSYGAERFNSCGSIFEIGNGQAVTCRTNPLSWLVPTSVIGAIGDRFTFFSRALLAGSPQTPKNSKNYIKI